MTYKALRNASGEWVVIFEAYGAYDRLTTGIPVLMSEQTTMETLGQYYADVDFTSIELVTLEITVKP